MLKSLIKRLLGRTRRTHITNAAVMSIEFKGLRVKCVSGNDAIASNGSVVVHVHVANDMKLKRGDRIDVAVMDLGFGGEIRQQID